MSILKIFSKVKTFSGIGVLMFKVHTFALFPTGRFHFNTHASNQAISLSYVVTQHLLLSRLVARCFAGLWDRNTQAIKNLLIV